MVVISLKYYNKVILHLNGNFKNIMDSDLVGHFDCPNEDYEKPSHNLILKKDDGQNWKFRS